MKKVGNKLLLVLVFLLIFTISEANAFIIRNTNCSSLPMSYEVLRSKNPIKIVDYTYNIKEANVEKGILEANSQKQIDLDDSNGQVQLVITKEVIKSKEVQFTEYFFHQNAICITSDKKKCYAVPKEFFKSDQSSGLQNICSNKTISSTNHKDISITQATIAGTPIKPMYTK